MAVNWSLAGQPANPLQALQAFGMAQQQQQQMAQAEQEAEMRRRELALRERQFGLQQRKAKIDAQKVSMEGWAEAVQDVLRRPENERPAAWDAYTEEFSRINPEAAQFKGRYSENLARTLLAQAGKLSDFNKANEPKLNITGTGNGAYVVQRGNELLDPNSGQWIDYGRGQTAQQPMQTMQAEQGAKTIDKFGADAMRQSMGTARFEAWKQRHGVTETGGSDVALPAGFILDN